ncbi:hypothetical protein N7486_000639 [Penicillium sp. IBT 16267x]|nr:hypothetical protein N7486_000639 [Penicillium sp. IBT 16267x]
MPYNDNFVLGSNVRAPGYRMRGDAMAMLKDSDSSAPHMSNMGMDLLQVGSWANTAPTFPAGSAIDLSDLSGTTYTSTTTFPNTRPGNRNSPSLEAYLNAPRSSQPWSPVTASRR